MSLDIKKLENVLEKPDGKITARCPACALDGSDKKGEHLVVFSDGNFGCVKYPKDAEHRRKIHSLAGDGKRLPHTPVKLIVNPFNVPKSTTVMSLAAFPRFSNAIKRQWPSELKPREHPVEVQKEESSQMAPTFMDDLRQAPQNEQLEFPNNISKFNVPPKPDRSGYPALPPNPMSN
jgi:hypothetical protein